MTARRTGVRGFTLIEVLVSLTILLVGVIAILFLFPTTLDAARKAEYRTKAAFLAQLKAEEIRRDDDTSHTLVQAIESMNAPSAALAFAQEPDLAYQFSGRSILYEG